MRDATATRKRIMAAADELFYGEGVRTASLDKVAACAGVTKRTLYYHFRSKDDLIAAYLEARDEPTRSRYREWIDGFDGPLAQRLVGMFGRLAEWAKAPKWKGCGFARAATELAGAPGHPAVAIAARHKKTFESWLRSLLREEGFADVDMLSRQLMILLDGAITHLLIHRDPTYAHAAGQAALALLETAKRAASPCTRGASRSQPVPAD